MEEANENMNVSDNFTPAVYLSQQSNKQDVSLFEFLRNMARNRPEAERMANKIIKLAENLENEKLSKEQLDASQHFYAVYLALAVLNEVQRKMGWEETRI